MVPCGTASRAVAVLSPRGYTITALSPVKVIAIFVSAGPGALPMLCVTISSRRMEPSGFRSAAYKGGRTQGGGGGGERNVTGVQTCALPIYRHLRLGRSGRVADVVRDDLEPADGAVRVQICRIDAMRSEEHTSELQSHSFISYAVFCLKK